MRSSDVDRYGSHNQSRGGRRCAGVRRRAQGAVPRAARAVLSRGYAGIC